MLRRLNVSHRDRVQEFDERIRQLCARLVRASGEDFQEVLLELANAVDLWYSAKARDDEDGGRAAKAS